MSDKERSATYDECVKNEWLLEDALSFNELTTAESIAAAASRLLMEKFDISCEGSYISEIISIACQYSQHAGELMPQIDFEGDLYATLAVDEFELFERQRCKAVKESRDSCNYAGLKGVYKDSFNKPMLDIIKSIKE
jgi:hypothetical protein